MKRTRERNKWLSLAALLAIAAFEAASEANAQDNQAGRHIVISIPDRKLALLDGDRILKIYDVAVGAASTPSPRGEFKIVSHAINPVWKGVAPGPNNPVGTRWLGLSAKGYGIHGTNAPGSIGQAASHGCIRMRNRDVEQLFNLVPNGAAVELTDDRLEIVTRLSAEQAPLNLKGE